MRRHGSEATQDGGRASLYDSGSVDTEDQTDVLFRRILIACVVVAVVFLVIGALITMAAAQA